jgi:D-sedoheptulose 7-phosphate isomerase
MTSPHHALIQKQLEDSISVKQAMLCNTQQFEKIQQAIDLCLEVLKAGKKIMICGNGGSAADAQHFAAELISRFEKERRGLPALALTTDSSILTAIGNDYSYSRIFARQVEALGQKGDLLIGLSTSGKSENVLLALDTAKKMGLRTLGLTGNRKGPIVGACDVCIEVPSANTARIQESHLVIEHAICSAIEEGYI